MSVTRLPQQKRKLLNVLDLLHSNTTQDSLAGSAYVPHKKLKKEGEEEEEGKEGQKQALAATVKKSEQYEIFDLSKTRNVPHLDGQFACYIYIDVTAGLASMVKAQSNFKTRVVREYPTYQFVDIPSDNFHISLSKTFYLSRHQIDPFIASLTQSNLNPLFFCHNTMFWFIQKEYLLTFEQMSLSVDLNRLKVFSNEDRNRFFIAASVGQGKNLVKDIVNQIDNCLQAYGLDTFFKGNKHHISLLWTTHKATQSAEFKLYVKDNRFNSTASEGQVVFDVSNLQIKIGNRNHNIQLQKS